MKIFNLLHKLLFFVTFVCVCPVFAYADVSCPTGYVAVNEDAVYVSTSGSCPAGHTQLGGEYGGDSIINCIDGLANGDAVCTFFDTPCQSGKYFDGMYFQTCQPETYCDSSGTATPGTSGCSAPCPDNSTSESGASYCTCKTGYTINGVVGGAVTTTTTPCIPISCGAGYYLNGDTCEICPKGSYCPEGSIAPTACPDGGTTAATNSADITDCYKEDIDCSKSMLIGKQTCFYGTNDYDASCGTCTYYSCKEGYVFDETATSIRNICSLCPAGSYCTGGVQNACPELMTSPGGNTATSIDACECISGLSVWNDATEQCELDYKFTITTVPDADTFSFNINASGQFYVDWGDGNKEAISGGAHRVSHNYENADEHVIKLAGVQTGVQPDDTEGVINFVGSADNGNTIACNIAKIDGSLGAIFNIENQNMFNSTFYACANLTSVPEQLFSGITTPKPHMFVNTFTGTGLRSVPDNLFASINGSAFNMFARTFENCKALTDIPGNLFANVSPIVPGIMDGSAFLFGGTFLNSGLTSIPENLFAAIDNVATGMFAQTFSGTSITSIPPGLFAKVTSPSMELFIETFKNTKITELPQSLFANLTGKPSSAMFQNTFSDNSYISQQSWIPKTLFETLDSSDFDPSTMENIFSNTALATQCPSGMYQYITGFESAWDGKVSCDFCPDGYTSDAGATDISQCYTTCERECTPQSCPENSTNCSNVVTKTTGIQYYGDTCSATDSVCELTFDCNAGYDKLSLADALVRDMELIYSSNNIGYMCQLDGSGSDCDTLSVGQNVWEIDADSGAVLQTALLQTTCNDVAGDVSDPMSRVNQTADFSVGVTGAHCWERPLTVNSGAVPSSWAYHMEYSTAAECAQYCGNKKTSEIEIGAALAIATNTNVCAPHEYTVAYDCNGGSGNATDTVTYGETFAPNMGVCAMNGYTLAGYTIDGANVDDEFTWNYDTDKTLVAVWTPNKYSCSAGYYLNGTGCEKCTAGNYCTSVSDIEYDGKIYGLTPCPTAYPSSAPGASSDTQCYTACTMSNTDFANSASVTGKDYYGDGYDTCTVATCNAHYHRRPDLTDDQVITLAAQMNGMNPDEITDQDREMILSEMEYAFNNWDAFFGSLDATYQRQITTLIDSLQQHNRMPNTNAMLPFLELYRDWNAVHESTGELSIPSDGFTYAKDMNGNEVCLLADEFAYLVYISAFWGREIDCDVAASQNTELAVFRQTAEPGDWLMTIPSRGIVVTGKSKCDYDYYYPCRIMYTSVNGTAMPELWQSNSDMSAWGEEEYKGQCEALCWSEAMSWHGLTEATTCAAYFAGDFVPDDANEAGALEQNCTQFADLWGGTDSGAYISYVCDADTVDIPAGQYLPAGTMTPIECPANSYCAGQDDAIYDATKDQGITPCPVGTVSAPGATAQTQCTSSVKLHIGDDVVMNLVSVRPTTSPVMVFQVGDTSYYAPMSATETPINSDTNAKYRVLYNETEYWVHDYTAQ